MKKKILLRSLPLLLILLLQACASPPAQLPVEPPPPPPPPEEPPPPPEPVGTAPLVGTTWALVSQYSAEDLRNPPLGSVTLQFLDGDEPRLSAAGPVNRILGGYRYTVHRGKSENPHYEEGDLAIGELARSRATGAYIRFEDLMVENFRLAQGYYISGERPAESRLVIFGGYGMEEIILFELTVEELPPEE